MTEYSQSRFRKMFESKYTSPEIRALLIQSLYTRTKANLKGVLEDDTNPLAVEDDWKLRIQSHRVKGEEYLRLAVLKEKTGFTKYTLNQTQKNEIMFWEPVKGRRDFLTQAMLGENVRGQKVSLLFAEYKTLLGALGYMTRLYMQINDPRGDWVFKSDEDPSEAEMDFEEQTLSVHQANTEIFIKHLQHMLGELYKYTDIMKRLGIDTTGVEGLVRTILDNANSFYSMNIRKVSDAFEVDEYGMDPFDVLNANHQAIVNMWDEAQNVGMQLDNYDLDKVTLKQVRYWEVIPRFVDYREDKVHTHYQRVSDGVANYFERLKKDLKPR